MDMYLLSYYGIIACEISKSYSFLTNFGRLDDLCTFFLWIILKKCVSLQCQKQNLTLFSDLRLVSLMTCNLSYI